MKGDNKLKNIIPTFELYSEFMGNNEEQIINDFCDKVRNELEADLTLAEYSKFRFWKYHVRKALGVFYDKFKKDTGALDTTYDEFCEFMWKDLDENLDEDSSFKKLLIDSDYKMGKA